MLGAAETHRGLLLSGAVRVGGLVLGYLLWFILLFLVISASRIIRLALLLLDSSLWHLLCWLLCRVSGSCHIGSIRVFRGGLLSGFRGLLLLASFRLHRGLLGLDYIA